MEGNVTELLRYALDEIESLEDYYNVQEKDVEEHVSKEIKKYLLGVLLDRFFAREVYKTDDITLSNEEIELVSKILKDFNLEEKEDGVCLSYRLNEERIPKGMETNPTKARREFAKLIQQPEILRESMLMMLLVKFEESISGVYRFLLSNYPQAYLSEKSITYSELVSLNSDIGEIRERFIEREIDEFMRMPISDWYAAFKKKHKATFSFDCGEFDEFKEIYYRRNIIVHNRGIVNEIYINNVLKSDKQVGDEIDVDEEYLINSFSLTKIILIGSFWGLRKVSKDESELEKMLFEYGYNCMVDKQWNIAKYIYSILLENEEQEDMDLLCERINRWIAIKNSEGLDKIKEEIEKLDVSAMKTQFSVAKYALLDEFEKVTLYLDEAIGSEMPVWCIKEWPLLNQYRESDEYITFAEKHAEQFKEEGYEPSKEIMENDSDIALELEESFSKSFDEIEEG